MPELSVLLAFIKAVFWTNFPAIAYGGVVPPVMASFYVWVTGKQFPLKSRIKWGLIVGVLLAIFMAWSEQYKARNILEAEVHSLRERMQIAQKTTLQSVIEISDPVIISNKKSGDGWLVYYLSNVGMAETKVILAESTIVLSEQRNQYKYPNEFILQPKRGKFELRVPIPPLTAKNMASRENPHEFVLKLTHRNVLGDEHVTCHYWVGGAGEQLNMHRPEPEECKNYKNN